MSTWTNSDGLIVRFGTTRADSVTDGLGNQPIKSLEIKHVGGSPVAIASAVAADIAHLPANALITDAFIIAETAWTGTGTITVGLANAAGSAIDADGIDAAVDVDVALAAIGDTVACDGELVDKTATIGTAPGWIYVTESGSVVGTCRIVLNYTLT